MGLPNWITLARVALVPVFLVLALGDSGASAVAAFVVFGVATASDSLDGYLARRRATVSRAGEFLDPLADKLLVGAALVALVATRGFPLAAAIVIAVREIAVQVLRVRIVTSGGHLPASTAAKLKTSLQLAMLLWWLLPWERPGPGHWVLLAAALAATLWSGVEYFVRAQRVKEAVP
jgi:CDP-diacylglycerol--glycerol-3-phosphate 3-phosphatidyltransferase